MILSGAVEGSAQTTGKRQVDSRTGTYDARTVRRATLASSIGTFMEFYDFGIYGIVAVIIAANFFPRSNPTAGLLLTFGVWALSFVARPLGAIVFGALGDSLGRQPTLVIVFLLMATVTTAMGVLPGYASIGVAAPILLLIFRLGQGFSAGGEVANAWTFVAEYAQDGRRGWLTSWQQFGSVLGLFCGSSFAFVLTQLLGNSAMSSWGWRLPFLFAAPLGLIGLYFRTRLDESPKFQRLKSNASQSRAPLRESLTPQHLKMMLRAFLVPMLNNVGYFVLLIYMPTYLSHFLKLTPAQSFGVLSLSLLALLIALPQAGRLSDVVGRKPVVVGSAVALAVLAYPYYWAIGRGSVPLAIAAGVVMAVLFAGNFGVISVLIVEMFPTRLRTTTSSIGANISTMVFGGAGPLLLTYVISQTHNLLAPAYFMMITALGTAAVVSMTVRESAHAPLIE